MKGHKCSNLSLAHHVLSVACCDGNLKDWPALAEMFHQNQNIYCCLSYNFYLIIIDDTQPCNVLEI